MRDGLSRPSRLRKMTGTFPASGDVSVGRWRTHLRPAALAELIEATEGLVWTRELLMALLEELHVTDEFDELVDRLDVDVPRDAPRLLTLALFLRHSWDPADLAAVMARVLDPGGPANDPPSTKSGERTPRCLRLSRTLKSRRRTRKELR